MLKRIVIVAAVLILLGYGLSVVVRAARQVGVNQGYEPDQPIAYSHKLHAGDNKIPCLYCHFAAEKGRHAGIPPASVCMGCHAVVKKDSPEIRKIREAVEQEKPIEWIKVHRLPDYVYFNHSQHVVGRVETSPPQAGVEGEAPRALPVEGATRVPCNDCHGPVETMIRMRQEKPLTMGWCLDCHRQKGIGETGQDCSKCHY